MLKTFSNLVFSLLLMLYEYSRAISEALHPDLVSPQRGVGEYLNKVRVDHGAPVRFRSYKSTQKNNNLYLNFISFLLRLEVIKILMVLKSKN